ncbi:class I SAM-dependent methyltransferase [Jeotgalibacillus campisalis]|uniref:SAM-dependent methyltransferase n=1 Tax=Jeotgalibacillus campisalis TaxID=220754 RepID=A0A0C2VGJ1_9BACL|nr:class I SAM-dependent methyltransferase [Jeotgalibacillus campisalis]KIL47992.1 hypothetical protein KR50_21590 [Jeotgalibacillus campisalis]
MIVIASGKADKNQSKLAEEAAYELNAVFKERNKKSISYFIDTYGEPILVIGKNRFEYYDQKGNEPFFFHPNSSAFRLKRLINGEEDPLINASGLKRGDSFLDCTMGLGADLIVASFVAGQEGRVTGIEKNPLLGYLVQKGLMNWQAENPHLEEAMRRIEVQVDDHLHYLKSLKDESFDIIYFDPMFTSAIRASSGIDPLRRLAAYDDEHLVESVAEAKRAAKKRVVFKDHYLSRRFKELGFEVQIRPSSKQHYGVINLE